MLAGDILGERARLTPDRTALVFVPTGERLTYRELDERARRRARVWREAWGLEKGDRLALLAGNGIEFLEAFFAAGKAGVILVPLSTRLTVRELAQVVEDCSPRVFLHDRDHGEAARALKDTVAVERWALLEDPGPDLPDSAWRRTRCDPEDVYCLLYTSGTTGRPKGVMLPHRMVAWNGYNTAVCWQLREDDVSPVYTPLYHAGGLGAFVVPIFTAGGTIVLHRGFEPSEVWRAIEQERATVVLGVPTIFKLLMEAPEFRTADLRSVRWFISGGAPLPLHIIEAYQARGVAFKQGYGLTEVGVNCFSMTVEESVRKKGSIGRPLMFTEARLVDEAGGEVPEGEVGELLLRGPHVSQGYWNNPEATAAALDEEGWFHTGDLARRDTDGFHTIAGRRKDLFISGGVNVYPAEVEGELLLHPDVQDAAVIGVPDPTWGEVGAAFVVPRPGGQPDGPRLAAFLEGRLARYKVPREFHFVDTLPRTPYGKVLKGELRERHRWHKALTHKLTGDGEPILLLNGGLMSIGAWEPLASRLQARHRILRCDFRGQLLSPGEPPEDLQAHVSDVVGLLDVLGLDRVHVVGTSFGALVGVQLASTHPSRVKSLTLVAATDVLTAETREGLAALRAACRQALNGGDGGRVFDLVASVTFCPGYTDANRELLRTRREQVAGMPPAWFAGLDRLLGALLRLDLTPHLPRVQCPTLVLAAEQDRSFPLERSQALARGIPGARLAVIPDAGHGLVIERPDVVAASILEFLS